MMIERPARHGGSARRTVRARNAPPTRSAIERERGVRRSRWRTPVPHANRIWSRTELIVGSTEERSWSRSATSDQAEPEVGQARVARAAFGGEERLLREHRGPDIVFVRRRVRRKRNPQIRLDVVHKHLCHLIQMLSWEL